jgi:Tfp pilus assembly protein PilF
VSTPGRSPAPAPQRRSAQRSLATLGRRQWLWVLPIALLIAGCAAPAVPPSSGLAELLERKAERALLDGIRAYDDGLYAQAEKALRSALGEGLSSDRDRATAHKLLAFITCTSERLDACRDQFSRARDADAAFALSRSEAGHPVWGPVYRSTLR